jgi:hypothetical protein
MKKRGGRNEKRERKEIKERVIRKKNKEKENGQKCVEKMIVKINNSWQNFTK